MVVWLWNRTKEGYHTQTRHSSIKQRMEREKVDKLDASADRQFHFEKFISWAPNCLFIDKSSAATSGTQYDRNIGVVSLWIDVVSKERRYHALLMFQYCLSMTCMDTSQPT